MKGKVLNVEKRKSKKGTDYSKLLVQFENGVCGFTFDFNCKYSVGDTVTFTVGVDYQNFARLELK